MAKSKTPRPKSMGTCALCGSSSESSEMSKHLKSCRSKATVPSDAKCETLFHVAVEGTYCPEYWMHLEAPADATLADLDSLLRHIWLECCDHLSAFEIDKVQYLPDRARGDFGDESMDVALGEVLLSKRKFAYQYDFGDTTALTLKVISKYEGAPPGPKDEPARILARNVPPEINCGKCGKTAVLVCVQCMYDGEGWLCKACAKKHEDECEGGEMMLPVLNSPRVGVCGYCGPEDEDGYAVAYKAIDEDDPKEAEGE